MSADDNTPPAGPDLAQGTPLSSLSDGTPLLGHVGGEPVMLVRRGAEVLAVGATCTHYGGPLAEGLVEGDTVRCPWHHACFNLRTGEPLRAPALNPITCWQVEQRDGLVRVGGPMPAMTRPAPSNVAALPQSIVIVGGGAAGNAAAETLRREQYPGRITMLSADDTGPYDRPNLSKNYLAGNAPEDWIPLRSADFYRENDIDLRLRAQVVKIDTALRRVQLADGSQQAYDALLLATGADPVQLDVPGATLPHVRTLRSLSDCRTLIERVGASRSVAVIGAGFIGLEVAASLRARQVDVHVIAPDKVPMEKVMGPEVGAHLRALHEQHGVVFHLGTTPASIAEHAITLKNGQTVPADCVVVGIGVRPATALAQQAGLAVDRGVVVDEFLQTSVPGIYAAGDIARWPDRRSGERIRVEHWVVAERQGQTAARNMLGRRERYDAVPFFWTEQYDFTIAYVGHAQGWNAVEIDGSLEARDCTITYRRDGRALAVATVQRDTQSLRAELAFERAAV
jgi:NADPH-dependent 2,4-dienoyl-CoA reductase/sulfur reductase-like enzyme/nitrite reductase/ring-hydroxylating ferredoxin subunit